MRGSLKPGPGHAGQSRPACRLDQGEKGPWCGVHGGARAEGQQALAGCRGCRLVCDAPPFPEHLLKVTSPREVPWGGAWGLLSRILGWLFAAPPSVSPAGMKAPGFCRPHSPTAAGWRGTVSPDPSLEGPFEIIADIALPRLLPAPQLKRRGSLPPGQALPSLPAPHTASALHSWWLSLRVCAHVSCEKQRPWLGLLPHMTSFNQIPLQ